MANSTSIYPKLKYVAGEFCTVLQSNRKTDKIIEHPRDKPGNIILVHGVNDVGTGYSEVEQGLCAGLEQRLKRRFKAAEYSLPTDKDTVVEDPDAVYFKRKPTRDTDSPVIPFYWGFREIGRLSRTVNGQRTDRFGNRLDKDLSKGGGPFGNATCTLPDMWNRGGGAPVDPMGDPLRPILKGPGRMHMVLAARRLAALVAMIRDYGADETVTIVAHSQGCMLSLLAQAFLMERGERTADTLILTHPPYSLEEDVAMSADIVNWFSGGEDDLMNGRYEAIAGAQSLHGRLQTLVNVVKGVATSRATQPVFAAIGECTDGGMVEGRWKPDADRDNRGKVYLYFCPEDMTVAIQSMVGIGWQGVPDYIEGTQVKSYAHTHVERKPRPALVTKTVWVPTEVRRMPLKELGSGFRQRVFTSKPRFDPQARKMGQVPVGCPPHDFVLRLAGEDDHAHVAESGRGFRASHHVATWPIDPHDKPEEQRAGIRRITGEALKEPYLADLRGNQIDADKLPAHSGQARIPVEERGPCEEVDPITAAIAIASEDGLRIVPMVRPDPAGKPRPPEKAEPLSHPELMRIQAAYNAERNPKGTNEENQHTVVSAMRHPNGKVVALMRESRDDARRRWQNELSAKSFHSAIFDSRENHRRVTAYDVAIGRGLASTDPKFHGYLCAVADWRLKQPAPNDDIRPEILTWKKFLIEYSVYLACEPAWRRELIEGNMNYYSTGDLPRSLPLLAGRLLHIMVTETTSGKRPGDPVTPAVAR